MWPQQRHTILIIARHKWWGYVVLQEAPSATGYTNDNGSLTLLHFQHDLIPALPHTDEQPTATITHSSSHHTGHEHFPFVSMPTIPVESSLERPAMTFETQCHTTLTPADVSSGKQ